MNRCYIFASFIILLFLNPATVLSSLPGVSHYSLTLHLFLKEQQCSGNVVMTVTNSTDQPVTSLPFVLYRLLEVNSINDADGDALVFTQDIVRFSDERSMQVNAITIQLPEPLQPESSFIVQMRYGGSLFGYPEVMGYVRDRIDEDYSLIRPDAIAYPMLALPSFESYIVASGTHFTYRCSVSVPAGYTVACGGLRTNTMTQNDTVTFSYSSKIPTWRIDVAVAKFTTISDSLQRLFVHAMPRDSSGAVRVLQGMRDAIGFYTKRFGEVKNFQGYTAIEIPDGWGSQASDYYFLQTSAAFRDSAKLPEVYHEIAHTWNVNAKPETQRCRYFDEAFASYFEALAIKEFEGEEAFLADMEKSRSIFIRWVQHDKKNFSTPIAEYGKHELGNLSYTKGAWSLYALHTLAGDVPFNRLIRGLLETFSEGEIDFKQFQLFAEKNLQRNLSLFFNDWMYSDESSRLLTENISIEEIVKRYK